MKTSAHTPEQIIRIIEQAEKGEQSIAAICREHGIAENTLYRWRKTYGGMSVNEAQRLKELKKRMAGSSGSWPNGCLRTMYSKNSCKKKADSSTTA